MEAVPNDELLREIERDVCSFSGLHISSQDRPRRKLAVSINSVSIIQFHVLPSLDLEVQIPVSSFQ